MEATDCRRLSYSLYFSGESRDEVGGGVEWGEGGKVFVCLFVLLFFFGGGGAIQKYLKIRGSACVSQPRSSAKVFFFLSLYCFYLLGYIVYNVMLGNF